MLEQGCVVTDKWTANRCFDQKEELVYIEPLRDEGERDGGTKRKEDSLKVVRVRVVN